MTSGRLEKETIFYARMQEKLKEYPDIFTEYFNSMRANRKSYTTIQAYIDNALHLANFLYKDELAKDFYKYISATDIENYMISLETRTTKHGIQRTGDDILQTRWSALNTFFNWLVKRKYLDENPMLSTDRPKNNTEHKIVYLTQDEINKLFDIIDKNPYTFLAIRDKTMISLALSTALRIGAILNINLEDIDFENNTISVIEKRQKVLSISIGKNTANLLKQWIELRNKTYPDINTDALFISQHKNRISEDATNNMLKKYCEDAHIKQITFHKLRATAACMLAQGGVPIKTISKQLNHTSISVTQRYVAAFEEDRAKATNLLDSLCY